MNGSLIRIFICFRILTVIYSQTLASTNSDPIVIYSTATTATINFLLLNPPSPFTFPLACSFVNTPANAPGYGSASVASANPTATANSSLSYVISLSAPFVIGRTNGLSCGFAGAPQIARLTKYVSVRPAIRALICSSTSGTGNTITVVKTTDTNLAVNIPFIFTDSLTLPASLTCTRATTTFALSPSLSAGMTTVTGILTYQTTVGITSPDSVTCQFSMGTSSSTATVSIILQDRSIAFSPANIITSSPVIQLSLLSNYNPPADFRLNCSISLIPTPTCPPTINALINWTLSPSSLTFQANVGNLTMTRSGLIPNTTESYRVICCDATNTVSYIASVTITNQATEYPVIATGAETVYNDTRYFPLSSCPCDLTVAVCDPNCCCDPFCNCAGNAVAITGPYGGYFNDSLPYSCKYQDTLTKSAFHSLLCVEYDSSNILGDHIPMQPIINDGNTFTNVLSSSIRSNVFQIRPTGPTAILQGASSLIQITSNLVTSTVAPPYLYLPKQSLNSPNCNLQNPIVLLQEFDSTCTYVVTGSNCATFDDPRLSSFFYLISSSVSQTNCINNVVISSVQGNVPIYTFYRCINAGAVIPCSFTDDGFTLPPTPAIANNVCQNVVGAVTYRIFYNSSAIVSIGATIDLTSVSLGSTLNQRFIVSFASTNITREAASVQSYSSLQTSVATTNVPNISGLFGYDDGKPILTVSNTSASVFVTMKILPASPSNLCNNVPGNNVLFRQNTFVQCNYDISGLTNCNDKRNRIKDYLDSLFGNPFVAIYGNPSSPADYVAVNTVTPVLTNFPNVTMTVVPNNFQIPLESMLSYCGNIATGIFITVYYSRQGRAQNQYINNIVGVAKRYQVTNLTSYTPYGGTNSSSNLVTLSSYVEFQLVSAGISGDQSTDDNVQPVCLFDVCINELFYPWMFNYEGKRGFYEQAFGLFLLGLAVFLLATTYPWW